MNKVTFRQVVPLFIIAFVFWTCSSNKKDESGNTKSDEPTQSSEAPDTEADNDRHAMEVIVSEDKGALKKYYEIPFIKEFYGEMDLEFSEAGPLKYPQDLSSMSFGDLRLLRNEIFARNGYLFNDSFLRGYFNRFKWYMPIFDVDTFKIILNKKEQDLVNAILVEEGKRKENKFVKKEGLQLYNAELAVNEKQFKTMPAEILSDLASNNFSIVNANRSMPFYVYDNNAYQYIPHYITTDIYLFILHKYFSSFLEKLDENVMSSQLNTLLGDLELEIDGTLDQNSDPTTQEALKWAKAYVATAHYAAGGAGSEVPSEYQSIYQREKEDIDDASGKPTFIKNEFVSYEELKPRGHYTKSDTLKKYFRGFKWISLNGIDLKNDQELQGMMAIAHIIKNKSNIHQVYEKFINTIEKLAGQEDNVSVRDIIKALPDESLKNIITSQGINEVRSKLGSLNKERVKRVFGEDFKTDEKGKTRVFFLSSTYSLSGEIFSRLVHVNLDKSKRPFPKGLDIPAVFGNKRAEDILFKEYKENDKWQDYGKKLKDLQKQFRGFDQWKHNYGFLGVKTALSAADEAKNYPDFMKTDAYDRKELSTMLASWTHIKHDLILYQEKPFAAEAGQGGGPEPPDHYSYVEPNMRFWNTSLELVEWLTDLGRVDKTFEYELREIKEIGELCRNVAEKEINGEEISQSEFDQMHWIGGSIERILLQLLETDHLPEREKSMALIADVYVYNRVNLNVAVGNADDIYVLVPIKGEYYISRGSVFSYYEFRDEKIYNDEEWKERVANDDLPERPSWISPLIRNVPTPEGQMQFRYAGYGLY